MEISCLGNLPLDGNISVWKETWPQTDPTPIDDIPFIKTSYITEKCRLLKISREIEQTLISSLGIFNTPESRRLFVHCRKLLITPGRKENFLSWPQMRISSGHELFYAYVVLSAIDETLKIYRLRGIPLDRFIETFSDLEIWINTYKKLNGIWGFSKINWLYNHVNGLIYRLGRLQFMMENFPAKMNICRCPDGNISLFLTHEKADITKNKILCKYLNPAISVHISADGSLDNKECEKSFRLAREFFPRYFPEYDFNIFFCHSWLCNPFLAQYLGTESNISRFQQRFHIYPLEERNENQIFEYVFGKKYDDINSAPRDSALRKVVADHIIKGGKWYMYGGMILKDESDHKDNIQIYYSPEITKLFDNSLAPY